MTSTKTIKELHSDREKVFKHKWHESVPPQIAQLQGVES